MTRRTSVVSVTRPSSAACSDATDDSTPSAPAPAALHSIHNVSISAADILSRAFRILMQPVPTCTFVSVNRRNDECQSPHCNVTSLQSDLAGLHHSVDLPIQTYTKPVPSKYGLLSTNNRGYTDIFTVYVTFITLQLCHHLSLNNSVDVFS